MAEENSLESFLQILINSSEEDKRNLLHSALILLKEVCNSYKLSPHSVESVAAQKAKTILEQLLECVQKKPEKNKKENTIIIPSAIGLSKMDDSFFGGLTTLHGEQTANTSLLLPPEISQPISISAESSSLLKENRENKLEKSKAPELELEKSVAEKEAMKQSSQKVFTPTIQNSEEFREFSRNKQGVYEVKEETISATNISSPMKELSAIASAELRQEFSQTSEEISQEHSQTDFEESSSKTGLSAIQLSEESHTQALLNFVERWNAKVELWFRIQIPDSSSYETILKASVTEMASLRSNLASAASVNFNIKEELKRFDRYWKILQQEAEKNGYEIFPKQFGRMTEFHGQVIYSSRPNLEKQEIMLLSPGIRLKENEIMSPVTLVTLPKEENFPPEHPDRDFMPQWRAILGEMELLLLSLDLHQGLYSAIEAVNKNNIEPLEKCKVNVVTEIKRRADSLRSAIRNEENIYRLATHYWRVEECFWSIFHNDQRPDGYSFFDRLRKRLQAWRSVIRNESKLIVKDFNIGTDSLDSTEKYVGEIISCSQEDRPPGIIIRELRPAIVLKSSKTNRLLRGRVIVT